MKDKSIDLDKKTVTVGTGNTFKEIFDFVNNKSNGKYVVASGGDSSVGPYGWSTGGGHGRLTKMYGLGVDNIVDITLVKVDGEVIFVNE